MYVLYDQYGYLYIMDSGNNRIQRWIPGATYGITVVAATMSNPRGMRFDAVGSLVVADCSQHRVISFGMQCRKNFQSCQTIRFNYSFFYYLSTKCYNNDTRNKYDLI